MWLLQGKWKKEMNDEDINKILRRCQNNPQQSVNCVHFPLEVLCPPFNSLSKGRSECNYKDAIFDFYLLIGIFFYFNITPYDESHMSLR